MAIQNIKQVISYVPEAIELTKQAHVTEEFPVNSKDSSLMSALEITFLEKVAGQGVPFEIKDRVQRAVSLYGASEDASRLSSLMLSRVNEKQASEVSYADEVNQAQEVIESMTSGMFSLEKIAQRSADLYDNYSDLISSDIVKRYAGAGMINKEAAHLALSSRYQSSGDERFMKIASIINGSKVESLSPEENRMIADAVTGLDKEAGLYNLDFYKEAIMVKAASISSSTMVDLGGRQVSAETIIAKAPLISNVIGTDVAADIENGSPVEVKAIVESLPMDLKAVMKRYM